MTENDLRNLLVVHLRKQGITEIEIEVQNPFGGRFADLVYIDLEGKINVVELKKHFNKTLFHQIRLWKHLTPRVWAAVMSRGRKDISCYFNLGFGILVKNGEKEFNILAKPDQDKEDPRMTSTREKLQWEEKLLNKFRWVQSQQEEVIKQKCYHSFKCKSCGDEVHMGWTQYVRFYRDDLKMLRTERYCSACGGKL